VNSNPLSEVTCCGMPYLEKMCITKKKASSLEVHWIVVRIKIVYLVSWSTTTRIESQPEKVRRVSMKSIEIEFKRHSGMESCSRRQ
jgi:hypothetical protein